MPSEIVDRLRDLAGPNGVGVFAVALKAAADRIEDLELALENLEQEVALCRRAIEAIYKEQSGDSEHYERG
jgi:hypothetical protein